MPLASEEIARRVRRNISALRDDRRIEGSCPFRRKVGNTADDLYSIENIFKRQLQLAEIKRHITPHALRHTKAAMMVSSGADIRNVQEILGHTSILSTQVYKKLTIRGKRLPAVARRSAPMAMESVVPRLPIKK